MTKLIFFILSLQFNTATGYETAIACVDDGFEGFCLVAEFAGALSYSQYDCITACTDLYAP